MLRGVLVVIGLISLGLGVLGMFVPVLPTTPFLLLSAALFARSSEKLHRWLVEHPRLGIYIAGFLYGGGIPVRAKLVSIVMLWGGIAVSSAIIYLRSATAWTWGIIGVLVAIAVAVSAYILTRPTAEESAGTPATGSGERDR